MTKASFSTITGFFQGKQNKNKIGNENRVFSETYIEFYKCYLQLKNDGVIEDYLDEGGEKVVFTTPNQNYLIKLGKIPYEVAERENETIKFLKSQRMTYLIPKTKIKDFYIITERAEVCTEQFLKEIGVIGKELALGTFHYNYTCLNIIEDNSCRNLGVIDNAIVIIDSDNLVKEKDSYTPQQKFIMRNRKTIKTDWVKLNRNISNKYLEEQQYDGW